MRTNKKVYNYQVRTLGYSGGKAGAGTAERERERREGGSQCRASRKEPFQMVETHYAK